jgi:hypothetical protein
MTADPFDPPAAAASPGAPARRRGGRGLGVVAVLSGWVLWFLGPLSVLFPLVPLLLLGARRYRAAALCLLLSPVCVSVVLAVSAYCSGRAALADVGLPGTEFHNLDPDLRCGRSTSGCLVQGNEWMTQSPYNATLRAMIGVFGPQPGAYTGPYPSAADATGALAAAAQDVPLDDLRSDTVRLPGRVVTLDPGVGPGLLRASPVLVDLDAASDPYHIRDQLGPVRAALWKDACLIVRIPRGDRSGPAEPEQAACLAVIDLTTGRPFAYYAQGGYGHRFPPVTWKR